MTTLCTLTEMDRYQNQDHWLKEWFAFQCYQDCCEQCGNLHPTTKWVSFKASQEEYCHCYDDDTQPREPSTDRSSWDRGTCLLTSSSGRKKREIQEWENQRIRRQVANLDKQREVVCEPLGSNGEINYWKYEYEVPKYCWSEYFYSFYSYKLSLLFLKTMVRNTVLFFDHLPNCCHQCLTILFIDT